VREENGLTLFENKIMKIIFGSTRVEVTGGWRKLPNLYSSPSIWVIKSRKMAWVEHTRNSYYRSILTENCHGKRTFGGTI
jgi:hypothetical protein